MDDSRAGFACVRFPMVCETLNRENVVSSINQRSHIVTTSLCPDEGSDCNSSLVREDFTWVHKFSLRNKLFPFGN